MTIDQTMNQILKLKIKQFKDDELEIDQDKLMNCSTLMRESELLRIAKHLNPDNTKPSSKRSNYPYIKDIVITDIGEETDLYKGSKGYLTFNEERFKRLMASSGNIRNSKVAFVRESISDKVNDILLCGLPVDQKYDVFAKFSSYYALCSTDSIPLTFLPRIVIIDDFKHEIEETFDLLKDTGKDQYKVVNNQKHKTEIMPFDGAGLVSVECALKFCNDLEIDISKDDKANEKESKSKIPACWQFRFIPCGKGDLFTFDIKGFALEKGVKQITDMWGRSWDLFDAEGNLLVDVILTKSQFKFHKLYTNYDAWFNAFTTETHGYKRTFNISAYSDVKHFNDSTVLSYQPLQTLSLSQDQVEKLCYKTVTKYKKIRNDIMEFVKYRGMADKVDEETGQTKLQEDHYLPAYYEALKANVDLFNDDYIQSKIKDDLKGFRNRSCKGMLFLRGNFQTLIPDLVGLAQYAFNLPVTGVLKQNEVYNQFWYSKNVGRIALCRFPHIAREWKVADVVKPDCDGVKYLDYISEGYVINIWDSTALRLGTADFDGDHIYGIAEGRLLEVIAKQESNTILHIPPEQTEEEKKNPKPTYPINDMAKLIETDCNGMQGGIGQCVNDITTLWSLPQTEQRDNYIKIMSVIGAQIIDYAKTGILANAPKEIKKFLHKHKLPYFMGYKYSKEFTKEKRINVNRKIKGLSEPIEKLNKNQCTVNMICWYLEKQFAEIDKAAEDNRNGFEWQKLLKAKDKPNPYSHTYKAVEKMMEEFNEMHSRISQSRIFLTQPQDLNDNNYKYKIFYDYVRNSLLSLCRANADIDKILDYLLIICYTDKKYVDKAILWNCFPDEMVSRVKGEYFLEKNFDTKVFELKANKAKKKIEQNNMASELVKVSISIDQETKDDKGEIILTKKINVDVTNIKVNIYQSEVSYINQAAITSEQKRVLLVLLAINRLHKQNDARFFICPGKKNKITPSHICKLANISIREYEEIMKSLYGNGFYLSPTGQTNLLIDIPFMDDCEGTPLYTISDLNNLKKYFKILFTKVS